MRDPVLAAQTDKKPLTRLQANMLLMMTALIWGTTFVAQKFSAAHIGPLAYVSARFALSALLVLPLALREKRRLGPSGSLFSRTRPLELAFICGAFSFAVISQQLGIGFTTVARSGFLTGLYVLFVPVIAMLLYRQKLSRLIFPAALLSVAGVWLLSGATGFSGGFGKGEWLTLLCAIGFGWQVVLVGRIMNEGSAAFMLSCLQYAAVAFIAGIGALMWEHTVLQDILGGWRPIAYAGIMSGGIAYTAQIVAQRYTPAADSAVILSAESVFAAISGAFILHETLTPRAMLGCALIIIAILMVEGLPHLLRQRAAV